MSSNPSIISLVFCWVIEGVFDLNLNMNPLIQTLPIAPSVSVLMWFDPINGINGVWLYYFSD